MTIVLIFQLFVFKQLFRLVLDKLLHFHNFHLFCQVPQLAASLMPICEVFGSRAPNITWKLPTGEELSVHMLFSTAFILLMRLWRFNCPPLEHCVLGKGASLGSQLTPEYLLLVRNSQLASSGNKHREKKFSSQEGLSNRRVSFSSTQPIFMESFPKLSTWYWATGSIKLV